MDLFTVLNTSRESMVSHGSALATIADNLANSNTPGFKGERTEFGDLLSESLGGIYSAPSSTGAGVAVDEVRALHTQGGVEFTSNQNDFAITGEGFFVLSDGTSQFYSRAGNFAVGGDGILLTQDGMQVQGYTAESPDTLTSLNVGSVAVSPTATTTVTLGGNLNVDSEITTPPAAAATFQDLSAASEFNTSVEVIDSLGERHSVALHFFHTAQNQWTVQGYVDAEEVGGTPGTPQAVGTQTTLTFDAEGQQAEGAAALPITAAWSNGAAASSVTVDTSAFTGFATNSNVSSLVSDGLQSGNVVGFEVANNGLITGLLDNGSTTEIGTVALAKFANPASLKRSGSNTYVVGTDTSDAAIGAPDSEGRGAVTNGALETSNIDASKEFTDIIRYQRGYQGSSQAFTTANELLSTTLQLA